MENSNTFDIEQLEERYEMETIVPGDQADTDGWFCRCGYE